MLTARSCLFIPREPFIPIDPFRFYTPLSFSSLARCCSARAQETHGDRDIADCAVVSVRYLVYVYYSSSARFHSAHIFPLKILPRQFYLHDQLRFPSLYFSRVLRIFQPGAEPQWIIDPCAQYHTREASCCRSQRTGFQRIFLPLWLGPSSRGRVSSLCLRKRGKRLTCCRPYFFRESPFSTALEARTLTSGERRIYPGRMPDPGSGERFVDTHCSMCSFVSFGTVYFVRFDSMRSMYCAPRWAGVCLRCPLSPTVTSTHLYQQEAPKTETSSQ